MAAVPYEPPPAIAPLDPDFSICSSFYGTGLSIRQCSLAANNLPWFPFSRTYQVLSSQHVAPAPYTLPSSRVQGQYSEQATGFETGTGLHLNLGECVVSVELAGPSLPAMYAVSPDTIRGMAGWVINKCVHDSGTGGFVTHNIGAMLQFLSNPLLPLRSPFGKTYDPFHYHDEYH